MTFSGDITELLTKTMPLNNELESFKSPTFPKQLSKRYKYRRTIGVGGFGIVYLADDLEIGRVVAIKQLFKNLEEDPYIYERFLQEARISGQLEHPNIIILYNIERVEHTVFMVMEYLGGGSLDRLMHKQKQFEIRAAIQIMLGIFAGLEAAHHLSVVHRDIKPSNILFGIRGVPKITDFGIAHFPAEAGGSELLEGEGDEQTFIGTPLYMAPEQLLGKPIDTRADIYATGAIFYHMLTGQPPLPISNELSYAELCDIALNIEPRPISHYRSDVPEKLTEIIFKMIHKERSKRFESVEEIKKELLELIISLENDNSNMFLTQKVPTQLFWSSESAILEDILYLLLIDGKISIEERKELGERIEKLGISVVEARRIEDNVRQRLMLPSLADLDGYSQLLYEFLTQDNNNLTDAHKMALENYQKEKAIHDEEIKSIHILITEHLNQ